MKEVTTENGIIALQSKIMAITDLLISKGIATEEELEESYEKSLRKFAEEVIKHYSK